jgi:calcineurin-like phosphoesterase
MKFFSFRQNNSFGLDKPPPKVVIVEAENAEDANKRILEVDGVYFDGCNSGVDCPCCGNNRWSRQLSYEVGDEVPSLWGDPLEFAEDGNVLVVYANGEKKRGLFHW